MDTGYRYILAYGIAIAVFMAIIKTRIGYNTMYYLLVLSLLLFLLVESKFIANALIPITGQTQIAHGLPSS